MLILSRVCAQFHDKQGSPIFRITPEKRLTFVEAPEAIRQDPLFRLLVAERSLEVAQSVSQKKALENDPETPSEPAGPAEASRRKEKPAARSGAASAAGAAQEGKA